MNECVQKGPFISRDVCNLVNNLTKRLLSTQLPLLDTFTAYFQFAMFICLIKMLLSTINWNIFGHLAARHVVHKHCSNKNGTNCAK